MDKYQKAILEYEETRQVAAKLEKKRGKLISNCTRLSIESGLKPCLAKAYDDTRNMNNENNDFYSYHEVFENGFYEGDYCNNCHEAYKLKHGELAKARKAFGIAKRRLSAIGKAIAS